MVYSISKSTFCLFGILAFFCVVDSSSAFQVVGQVGVSAGSDSKAVDDDIKAKLKKVRALEQLRIKTINKVKPAVVAVFGLDKKGGGSGVIIHPSGLALTNHHVVQGAGAKGFGGLDDGKQYPWDLIGNDPGGDLALIKLHRKEPFPYVELGDSDKVQVGDWTLVMGNPFLLAEDFNPTVTFGIVSGVKRYQKGMTDRLLVYGNCIQVDTSINPGNSGGPLFDIQGRLIGINGRASFDFAKRGRVNVGIGYAISINQCRNFLPDLMATKLVQHGGLDAVFEDRNGKVVCSSIFEDAELSSLGMDIGDQLLEFEGEKIRTANQFTNLLCTLPAGWPAKLTFKSQSGSVHKVTMRLVGLPYPKPGRRVQKKPKPAPKKEAPGKKGKNTPAKNQKKPKKPPVNKKVQAIRKSKADFLKFMTAKAGEVQKPVDAKKNASYVTSFSGTVLLPKREKSWEIESNLMEAGRVVGNQKLIVAPNNDFTLQVTAGKRRMLFQAKGDKFRKADVRGEDFQSWEKLETSAMRFSDFVKNPYALSALVLVRGKTGLDLTVDGSDSLDLTPNCRIELKTGDKQSAFCWYSFYDFTRPETCRLTKTGIDRDGSDGLGAVRYRGWKKMPFGNWPTERVLVNGINELKVQTWKHTAAKPMN